MIAPNDKPPSSESRRSRPPGPINLRLDEARRAANLSVQALADAVEKPYATTWRHLRTSMVPRGETLRLYAQATGHRLDWILTGDGRPNS